MVPGQIGMTQKADCHSRDEGESSISRDDLSVLRTSPTRHENVEIVPIGGAGERNVRSILPPAKRLGQINRHVVVANDLEVGRIARHRPNRYAEVPIIKRIDLLQLKALRLITIVAGRPSNALAHGETTVVLRRARYSVRVMALSGACAWQRVRKTLPFTST